MQNYMKKSFIQNFIFFMTKWVGLEFSSEV